MSQSDDFGPRRAHYAPRLVGLIRFSSFVPSAVAATQAAAAAAVASSNADSFITEDQVEEEVAHGLVGVGSVAGGRHRNRHRARSVSVSASAQGSGVFRHLGRFPAVFRHFLAF